MDFNELRKINKTFNNEISKIDVLNKNKISMRIKQTPFSFNINVKFRIQHHDLLSVFQYKVSTGYSFVLYHNPHASVDEDWEVVNEKELKGELLVIYEQLEVLIKNLNRSSSLLQK